MNSTRESWKKRPRCAGVGFFFHTHAFCALASRRREPTERMRARYRCIFSLSCPVSNHKQKWRLLRVVWTRFASVDVFTLDCVEWKKREINGRLHDGHSPKFNQAATIIPVIISGRPCTR